MFESKYNRLLTIILIVVIVAIIGLLGFMAFNYFQESNSTQEAAEFVEGYQGDDVVPENTVGSTNTTGESNPLEEMNGNTTGDGSSSSSTTRKVKKQYKGFSVDGTMKIPKINFSYPVLEKVTKSSIENSVAILYGAGLNKVGNTVIIGHNYRNGQFFSNNKKLSNGDKIYITDYQGTQKTYKIYKKFETTPEDTSFYQRDTNGKAEITLSTCTDDSRARLIILAKEE